MDDLDKLKLMYVNSIEDSMTRKLRHQHSHSHPHPLSNLEVIPTLVEYLNEAIEFLSEEVRSASTSTHHDEIARLKCFAKIRFCLIWFARIISSETTTTNDIDKSVLDLNRLVQTLVERHSQQASITMRFFLIKELFRKHGQTGFSKLTASPLFKWIIPPELVDSEEVSCLSWLNYC